MQRPGRTILIASLVSMGLAQWARLEHMQQAQEERNRQIANRVGDVGVPPTASPLVDVEPSSPAAAPVRARTQHVAVFCGTESGDAEAAFDDALLLAEDGAFAEAELAYLRAIELDPSYCDAMDNLGLLVRRQGRIDDAIRWYMRSIERAPANPVAHQNLAVAYAMRGQVQAAEEEWRLLIEIDPENPEGHYGLGALYLDRLDRPRDAIASLLVAERLYESLDSPLVVDAQRELGRAYLAVEDRANAQRYLARARDGGANISPRLARAAGLE
jgi:tetratricopeptide (TPR) repeat protein